MIIRLWDWENLLIENLTHDFKEWRLSWDPVIIDKLLSVLSDDVMERIKTSAIENTESVYRLSWTWTSKLPYTPTLLWNDMKLLSLQNNLVLVELLSTWERFTVWTYERLKEYSGHDKNEHEVIIYIKKNNIEKK